MPSKKITFATVRKIGRELPDVTESTAYGSPALKVRGKLLTCLAAHKSAEPDSLVVCIDFSQRAEMIAADPETYYLTDHYVDYPSVLVRLSRINLEALRDLIGMGWRFVNSRTSKGKRTAARQRRHAGPVRRS